MDNKSYKFLKCIRSKGCITSEAFYDLLNCSESDCSDNQRFILLKPYLDFFYSSDKLSETGCNIVKLESVSVNLVGIEYIENHKSRSFHKWIMVVFAGITAASTFLALIMK